MVLKEQSRCPHLSAGRLRRRRTVDGGPQHASAYQDLLTLVSILSACIPYLFEIKSFSNPCNSMCEFVTLTDIRNTTSLICLFWFQLWKWRSVHRSRISSLSLILNALQHSRFDKFHSSLTNYHVNHCSTKLFWHLSWRKFNIVCMVSETLLKSPASKCHLPYSLSFAKINHASPAYCCHIYILQHHRLNVNL